MVHEILFNATIPGAYMNAINVAKERDRLTRRHLNNNLELDKSAGAHKSVRAVVWAKLVSHFSRRAQGGACQTPAE